MNDLMLDIHLRKQQERRNRMGQSIDEQSPR